MSEIANARINTFGTSPKADSVSPSEESVFVLTSSQLQEIIRQATVPILQELQALRASQEADIERLALDIAIDRQRLARLEKTEPQPLQKDRGDILRALLAANGGKMLAKDARQKLRMDKGNFSRLLDTLKDHIDIKPLNSDKRKLLLIIKNRELVVHN
jgi:uncharacterized membrane protein